MPLIQFNQKNIDLAKINKAKKNIPTKSRKVFKCSIDGYNLRIGRYKITKIWAIKFAKWILKSFENYDNQI